MTYRSKRKLGRRQFLGHPDLSTAFQMKGMD